MNLKTHIFLCMFSDIWNKQSKVKGCLADIIGFVSPLLQQHQLPPSFIPFLYYSVSMLFSLLSMPSVQLVKSACTNNKRFVAPSLAVFEPGTYRIRGGRSVHQALAAVKGYFFVDPKISQFIIGNVYFLKVSVSNN